MFSEGGGVATSSGGGGVGASTYIWSYFSRKIKEIEPKGGMRSPNGSTNTYIAFMLMVFIMVEIES